MTILEIAFIVLCCLNGVGWVFLFRHQQAINAVIDQHELNDKHIKSIAAEQQAQNDILIGMFKRDENSG